MSKDGNVEPTHLIKWTCREFVVAQDRNEWVTGIKLTYSLGDVIEGQVRSKALRIESEVHDILSRHRHQAAGVDFRSLTAEHTFLKSSIDQYKRQLELRSDYQKSVFSDYIKGVRSTSDVLSAISLLESTHENYLERLLRIRVVEARIDQLARGCTDS